MTTVAEIKEARSQLVASVRSFVKEQLETWRLVPYLALQADGRDGGIGYYADAYKHGLWRFQIRRSTLGPHFIDCDSGRICTYGSRGYVFAGDRSIVRMLDDIDEIDALQVVAWLRDQIRKPRPSWISEEEAVNREIERQCIRAQLALQERYVRARPMVAA